MVRHSPPSGESPQSRTLRFIVGDTCVEGPRHAAYNDFRLWVATHLTEGRIDRYAEEGVEISHWDSTATARFPHLLGPCECGIYLPLARLEPGPMLASSLRLRGELFRITRLGNDMPPDFSGLPALLMAWTEESLRRRLPLEIR